MFVKGLPTKQIVAKVSINDKDYELEFINTDSHSDTYVLKVFLRKYSQDNEIDYKIRMIIHCNTLSYPALDMVWAFKESEYDVASKTFYEICNEVDKIKEEYDRSMAPAVIIAPKIRECMKTVFLSYQEDSGNISIDESGRLAGVSDWRNSLYGNRYPNMSKEEKNRLKTFEGNTVENTKRITHPTRKKKT